MEPPVIMFSKQLLPKEQPCLETSRATACEGRQRGRAEEKVCERWSHLLGCCSHEFWERSGRSLSESLFKISRPLYLLTRHVCVEFWESTSDSSDQRQARGRVAREAFVSERVRRSLVDISSDFFPVVVASLVEKSPLVAASSLCCSSPCLCFHPQERAS